ncbi:MAG: carbon monoxide dehydrogenase [Burkholderiales bacterium 68-12]|nr:MAG: carbon monoxide dehydrogenase [Burkholderiales bacterium 68-12]
MEMQGSRLLAVTQQQAWDALNDPEVLKACIPGCDSIEATGDHSYALVNAIKVGPVAAKFKGAIELAEVNAPHSYTLHFEGNGGVAGFGKGSAQVALTPGEAGCTLAYTVHATVGGKIAQVGQRLIDGVAKSMAESFFQRFDEEMQRRYPAPAAEEAPGAAEAAPPPAGGIPLWLWVALAVLAALAAVWALR